MPLTLHIFQYFIAAAVSTARLVMIHGHESMFMISKAALSRNMFVPESDGRCAVSKRNMSVCLYTCFVVKGVENIANGNILQF